MPTRCKPLLHLVGILFPHIYCDINGKMFIPLNKLLPNSLLPDPIIILIAFLYSKYLNTVGGISSEYYSISHYSVEVYETMSISTGFYPNLDLWNENKLDYITKGMVNHNNCICIHIRLNRSDNIASSAQFIYEWSICGFQESVLSKIRPKYLVYSVLEILLLSRHILVFMSLSLQIIA